MDGNGEGAEGEDSGETGADAGAATVGLCISINAVTNTVSFCNVNDVGSPAAAAANSVGFGLASATFGDPEHAAGTGVPGTPSPSLSTPGGPGTPAPDLTGEVATGPIGNLSSTKGGIPGTPRTWPTFADRYLQHLDAYLINVGPAAVGLFSGIMPKSLAPATGGRGPFLGSTNPFTSVPRGFGGFGIPAIAAFYATSTGQLSAATIGLATIAIGSYNVGVLTTGIAFAAFPGWNGLSVDEGK